jgi:hypothetical protein
VQKIAAGLLGAAAIAVGLIALRQPRITDEQESMDERIVPAGERVPSQISLDRIRELGL